MKRFLILFITLCVSSAAFAAPPDNPGPPGDDIDELKDAVATLETQVAELESLLIHFSRIDNEIYIDGANLNVTNGLGYTGTTNGLGNLIIGYNEERDGQVAGDRIGSHMLVLGSGNYYKSFGGIVAGRNNETSGMWASVKGGLWNVASGPYATVSGGNTNEASGDWSSVSGGGGNTSGGTGAAISGGGPSTATETFASVSGGGYSTASGVFSSITGGNSRTADVDFCILGDSLTFCD